MPNIKFGSKTFENVEKINVPLADGSGVATFGGEKYGQIPMYQYAETGRVTKRILELKERYPDRIIFGTIADSHVDISNENVLKSTKHATFALENVGLFAGCDFIVNLGDNVAGTNIDNATEMENARYMEKLTQYNEQIPFFNLVGNHCKTADTQKIYDLIGKYNNFDTTGLTEIRGYGYKDFKNKKVRIITLNTCDYWNVQGGNGMSYEQKDFFMRTLDLSDKNDCGEWTIIVLSHIPLDFLGGDYNKGADLKAILKAYNDGASVSITVNSAYATAENETPSNYTTYSDGALKYDYSGKNLPKVINIHGHVHTNAYGKLTFIDDDTKLNIVRIATANASFNGNASIDRYSDNGDYSITITEAEKIKKIAGTKADTSATFYFIDLNGQVIYSIGYGADIDRIIPYKDATVYNVIYNLSDVTSTNSATGIVEGEFYETTLSIAAGYSWGSIVVTMDGVDITSSVYSNGVITIPEVTGNIVITATAKARQWSETVSDVAVAIRQAWHIKGTEVTLENNNAYAGLGVTTPNDYGYADRESNTVYLMPVDPRASKVTVINSDGSSCTYRYVGIKDVDGTLTEDFDSESYIGNTYEFTTGSVDYIGISACRADGSSWPWGYDDDQISVTFSNY